MTIVAHERLGHWLVWFDELPNHKRAGETFLVAVALLLESSGWDRSSLDYATVSAIEVALVAAVGQSDRGVSAGVNGLSAWTNDFEHVFLFVDYI